ncbi:MAG: CRISPR-associated protein Cas4 [Candidatus Altiarchaeales archaeon]|nr:CRISPR-associated protein Cas4 [Candidatus Altiarchaeales archaeon]MBD3415621.1 CRISPR-associated protein Cas4 [Candidatus Altiarchaeales archaeon]
MRGGVHRRCEALQGQVGGCCRYAGGCGVKVISVSDLSGFIYCPRSVYLSRVLGVVPPGSDPQGRGMVGHAIRRELSMRQAKLVRKIDSSEDVETILNSELEAVISDIPYIFSERWVEGYSKFIPEVRSEVQSEIQLLGEELSALISDLGFERALERVTPWKTEYILRSEALNMKGRVDKVMRADCFEPVEIKTGRVPDGVWDGDRVQLCAYALLLEERFKEGVSHGFVEYTRVQERRPVVFTEKLRRQVIHARDLLSELLDGGLPDICPHGQPRKCESCNLVDECYEV